ncbi:MAG: hypothetical protein ABFC57_12350 [Veillonellales bacterium]
MILKTVYGPPPAAMERIEAVEPEEENCIREEPAPGLPAKNRCFRNAAQACKAGQLAGVVPDDR